MGTRRSKHHKGRKPRYKEHRRNLFDESSLLGGVCTGSAGSAGEDEPRPIEAAGDSGRASEGIWAHLSEIRSLNREADAGRDFSEGGRKRRNGKVGGSIESAEGAGSEHGHGVAHTEGAGIQPKKGRDRPSISAQARAQRVFEALKSEGDAASSNDLVEAVKEFDRGARHKPVAIIAGGDVPVGRGDDTGGGVGSAEHFCLRDPKRSALDQQIVLAKLMRVARAQWPGLTKDAQRERAHTTIVQILEAEMAGRFETIDYWANWMVKQSATFFDGNADKPLYIGKHDQHASSMTSRQGWIDPDTVHVQVQYPNQVPYTACCEGLRLIKKLPDQHRKVMEALVDGASPIDISNELKMPVLDVIRLMQQARQWMGDGGEYLG